MGGRGSSSGMAAGSSNINPSTINLTSGTTGQKFSGVANLEAAIDNSGYQVMDSSGSSKSGSLTAYDLDDYSFSVTVKYRSAGFDGEIIEVTEIKGSQS